MLREFFCEACRAWFDAFTTLEAGYPAKRVHVCGRLCSVRIRPGSRMAIKTSGVKSNTPGELRKAYQTYWGLTDNQMQHVTRKTIEKNFARHGLAPVDASWDDNVNGGKRERGELIELPPDTDDPNAVREYNAKKYGHEHVQQTEEAIRAEYDRACHPDFTPLPKADSVDVHAEPHRIDLESTAQKIAEAPVVQPERRQKLQGRLIAGAAGGNK